MEDLPGIHDSGYPQRDSEKGWTDYSVIQRTSQAGSSSCQCSTTLYGMRKEMKNCVEINSKRVEGYARIFLAVIGLSLGLVQQRSGTPHTIANPTGHGIGLRTKMMQNFQRSGHPIFLWTSALERGHLRSKGGKTTIHFTACDENVQSFLKMIISVNQLSLYGAVADFIKELPFDQRAPGKLVALDQTEQEILTRLLIAEVQADDERR